MKTTLYTQKSKNFQFKKTKKLDVPPILRPAQQTVSGDEQLTGSVHGKKASDIEERFAKALEQFNIDYYFQRFVETEYTLPDQEKQVDFVVYYQNRTYPVEIYGSYFHTSSGDTLRDLERERQLNEVFRRWGWEELQVVWDYELFDMVAAQETVRRLFT